MLPKVTSPCDAPKSHKPLCCGITWSMQHREGRGERRRKTERREKMQEEGGEGGGRARSKDGEDRRKPD
eukprot:2358939-Rhodomonas_salina.1